MGAWWCASMCASALVLSVLLNSHKWRLLNVIFPVLQQVYLFLHSHHSQ
jgi:hypothetical protein